MAINNHFTRKSVVTDVSLDKERIPLFTFSSSYPSSYPSPSFLSSFLPCHPPSMKLGLYFQIRDLISHMKKEEHAMLIAELSIHINSFLAFICNDFNIFLAQERFDILR